MFAQDRRHFVSSSKIQVVPHIACCVFYVVFISVCSLPQVDAQTLIDLSTQSKNIDFTRAPATAPVKTSPVLPATCSIGHIVLLTTAPVGANLYACINTNVWALQGNTLPQSAPNGSVLTWSSSSTEWEPRALATGPQGPKGDPGPQGPQGTVGPAGADGAAGTVNQIQSNGLNINRRGILNLAGPGVSCVDEPTTSSTKCLFPGTTSASDLTAGTLADARVAQSNVIQHQAALAISGTQLTSGLIPLARMQKVLNLTDLGDISAKEGAGSTVVMSNTPTITTPIIPTYQTFTDIVTPPVPGPGFVRFYSKSGSPCWLNSSGTEVCPQPLDSDLTAFASKSAPSGAVVGTTDTQTLSGKTLIAPVIAAYTVATLPLPGISNRMAIVTDAASAGSCTAGGGSARAWCRDSGSAWESIGDGTATGAGDASTSTSASVDGELAVFSGTGGKTLKRATGTGPAKLSSGVVSTGSINLASEITGILPVGNGGTGTTTATGAGNLVLSSSPTIVTPTIASFANAAHNHTSMAGGGQITDAAFSSAVTVAKGGTGATVLSGVLMGNGGAPVTGTTAVPVCSKYTIPYTSVQTAATTNDVALFTLPARGKITGITIKHSAAFAGSSITAVSVSIGASGNPTAYASAYNILQAVSNTAMQDDGGHYSVDFASHAVSARFISTGADLSALTTGSVDVWACTVVLP